MFAMTEEVDEEELSELLSVDGRVGSAARWFELTGWHEHSEAESVRAYYLSLVAPILTSAGAQLATNEAIARAVKNMLDELVWGMTAPGTSSRWHLRYVSAGAKDVFAELVDAAARRRLTVEGRPLLKRLRHEHVVERAGIVSRIIETRDAAPLSTAVACIVTKDEHDNKLATAVGAGWERYRSSGIDVWDRRGGGSWFLRTNGAPAPVP